MEGGDPHVFGFRPYEGRKAFAHFGRGLVRKGDGENAARPKTMCQQPCDASGEHAGLTGSGTSSDEQGLSVVLHRFHLLRIEVLDQTLRIAQDWSHILLHRFLFP